MAKQWSDRKAQLIYDCGSRWQITMLLDLIEADHDRGMALAESVLNNKKDAAAKKGTTIRMTPEEFVTHLRTEGNAIIASH